jgi:hypothetical protein
MHFCVRSLFCTASCVAVSGIYSYHPGYIPAGGDIGTLPPGTTLPQAETWCSNSTQCEGFTFVGPQGGPSNGTVYFKNNSDFLYIPGSAWNSYIKIPSPCDIYAAAGTPCVAAHSVVRALFSDYAGPLYQLNRSSDNSVFDVGVISKGGVADAAAQDAFCAPAPACLISRIYDQSGMGNHLSVGPPGGNNEQQVRMHGK